MSETTVPARDSTQGKLIGPGEMLPLTHPAAGRNVVRFGGKGRGWRHGGVGECEHP